MKPFTRSQAILTSNPTLTKHSQSRRTTLAAARALRTQLQPIATQESVASALNITRQAVEMLELRGLTKLIAAFQHETDECL